MSNSNKKENVNFSDFSAEIDTLLDNMLQMKNGGDIKKAGLSAKIRIGKTKDEANSIKDYEDYMKNKDVTVDIENKQEIEDKTSRIVNKFIEDKIDGAFE